MLQLRVNSPAPMRIAWTMISKKGIKKVKLTGGEVTVKRGHQVDDFFSKTTYFYQKIEDFGEIGGKAEELRKTREWGGWDT